MHVLGIRFTPLALALVFAGVLFSVIGLVYLTITAPHLPAFIPGHVTLPHHPLRNGRVLHGRAYWKRGVLALALAGGAFAGAWFIVRYDPAN
jgi:hypothetical protein